jgi:hypothetical protein
MLVLVLVLVLMLVLAEVLAGGFGKPALFFIL